MNADAKTPRITPSTLNPHRVEDAKQSSAQRPQPGPAGPANSAVARDMLVKSLSRPAHHSAGATHPEPSRSEGLPRAPRPDGWLLAVLLCLAAWLLGAAAVTAFPGALGWVLGAVLLVALPAGWLAWQLHLPPSDDSGARPS